MIKMKKWTFENGGVGGVGSGGTSLPLPPVNTEGAGANATNAPYHIHSILPVRYDPAKNVPGPQDPDTGGVDTSTSDEDYEFAEVDIFELMMLLFQNQEEFSHSQIEALAMYLEMDAADIQNVYNKALEQAQSNYNSRMAEAGGQMASGLAGMVGAGVGTVAGNLGKNKLAANRDLAKPFHDKIDNLSKIKDGLQKTKTRLNADIAAETDPVKKAALKHELRATNTTIKLVDSAIGIAQSGLAVIDASTKRIDNLTRLWDAAGDLIKSGGQAGNAGTQFVGAQEDYKAKKLEALMRMIDGMKDLRNRSAEALRGAVNKAEDDMSKASSEVKNTMQEINSTTSTIYHNI
ncbi:MAG: hypothetical protein JWP36_2307 [Paucimonas sp.]|nr:hypothetical protein [Paucimonas sp.]